MPSSRHRTPHNRDLSSRTDRAAGGTPAYLPDDKCGPVVVRKIDTPILEESPQEPSLLDRAADRIEQLLRQVACLEETRVNTIRLLDAANARIAALEAMLAEAQTAANLATARITRLENDARGHDRLAALLNTPA